MNYKELVENKFSSLRDICHKNPVEFLQQINQYRKNFKELEEKHFLFIEAYAYVKIGRYNFAESILNNLIKDAVLPKNYFFLVHSNLMLSLCYPKDFKKSLFYLQKGEEYARQAKDSLLLAACLAYQGDYYFAQRKLNLAENRHLQVQEILCDEKDGIIKLQSLLSLANINIAAQKYQLSLQYLYKAQVICDKENNNQFNLVIKKTIANVLMELKQFTDAEQVLLQVLDLSMQLHLDIQRIQILFDLAVMKLKSSDLQESLVYLDKCRELAKEKDFDAAEFFMDLYNNYAVVHALSNNIDIAVEYMEKATFIADKLGDRIADQEINFNFARMLIDLKKYEHAEKILLNCLEKCQKYKLKNYIFKVRDTLAKVFEAKKDFSRCIKIMKKNQADLYKQIEEIKKDSLKKPLECNRIEDLTKSNKDERMFPNSEFVGVSKATHKVLNLAMKVAKHNNVNVLIRGESGTGKEVLANLIHNFSCRKDNPFIPINAAAISSSLMESELFGHKKGSYTGAIASEKGFFLQAHTGTMFIDEITEIPIEFQSKLLRVLESRKVIPVGSTNEIAFDVRIISSSNKAISNLIENDLFRLDLFYRINTIEIVIPPLRERKDDIPVLVEHFTKLFCKDCHWKIPTIKSSFINRLQEYSFPGNVRELRNIIEKLLIIGDKTTWDADFLDSLCNLNITTNDINKNQGSNEKEMIIKALISCNGIRKDAAKIMKFSNSTMTRRIEKFGLEAYTNTQQKKRV